MNFGLRAANCDLCVCVRDDEGEFGGRNEVWGTHNAFLFRNDFKSRVVFMLCTLWFETMSARGTPEL